MTKLPELIDRFNTIPVKNHSCLFWKSWQTDAKIHIKMEEPSIVKTIEKKENLRT